MKKVNYFIKSVENVTLTCQRILPFLKTPLIIIAMALFLLNYFICEFFFSENISEWWFLKCDIYRVVIAIIAMSYRIGEVGARKFWISIFLTFITASIFDKNHLEIGVSDINIFIVGFSLSLIEYKIEKSNGQTK